MGIQDYFLKENLSLEDNGMSKSSDVENVRFTPWRGGQHPTLALMSQHLQGEGKRPFKMQHGGNYRCAVRSHGFSKTIYCVEGKIEIVLPDSRRRLILKAGDRLDIGAGVRHSLTVGIQGATVLEGTPERIAQR